MQADQLLEWNDVGYCHKQATLDVIDTRQKAAKAKEQVSILTYVGDHIVTTPLLFCNLKHAAATLRLMCSSVEV